MKEQGGTVLYDWQFNNDGGIEWSKELEANWLRDLLGVDYFHTVVGAEINDTKMSDLSPLADLKNLAGLYVDGTQVSDLSPLANMKNLIWLSVDNKQVSEEEIKKLEKTLPKLEKRR